MDVSRREEAYVQRMPAELQAEFAALSPAGRAAALEAMIRFHQVIEEETFRFALGMLKAKSAD